LSLYAVLWDLYSKIRINIFKKPILLMLKGEVNERQQYDQKQEAHLMGG